MTKKIRVAVEDAWRLYGRHAPSKISPYFTPDEWSDLTWGIHNAILPAIIFRQNVMWILGGLFAIPLLAFVFLLALVLTGTLEIQEGDNGEIGEYEEEAFQLLLLVGAGGCVGLAFLTLLLSSALRGCHYQILVEENLQMLIEDFEDARASGKDGVAIGITIAQPERVGVLGGCRNTFMAWCDLDFDCVINVRENFDDYSAL